MFFSLDREEKPLCFAVLFFLFHFFPLERWKSHFGLDFVTLLLENDRHYIRKGIQSLHHINHNHMGLHQIRTSHARALFTTIQRNLALPDSLCFRYFPTTAWPFPSIHPLKTTPLRGEPYPIPLGIVVFKFQNSDFALPPFTVFLIPRSFQNCCLLLFLSFSSFIDQHQSLMSH